MLMVLPSPVKRIMFNIRLWAADRELWASSNTLDGAQISPQLDNIKGFMKQIVNKKRTTILMLLSVSILLGTLREAAAAQNCTVAHNSYTMPAPLVVAGSLPINSQIGSTIEVGGLTESVCSGIEVPPGTTTNTKVMALGIGTHATYATTINGNAVFQTGIPGVGFSIQGKNAIMEGSFPLASQNVYWMPIQPTSTSTWGGPYVRELFYLTQGNYPQATIDRYAAMVTSAYQITFYKIGPISSSQNMVSLEAVFGVRYFFLSGQFFQSPLTINGLSIRSKGCAVTNSTINVTLDRGVLADFSNVGSTAHTKAFNIDLNSCDAGMNVSMYLEAGGAGSPNANLGLLPPDNNSSASGIALQLLYNNNPVKLGTTNAFKVVSSATTAGGSYSIPLAVRYYQTGASVKSGTVNSSATFTMVYN
ncbi:hypothetical protein C9426_29250 [Serratia sp. S1B]|nr:hypothetical protein C9426_29250 [Serratia sp. S1B]